MSRKSSCTRGSSVSSGWNDALAVELGEDLDARACIGDARSADEHPTQRLVLPGDLEIRLEARDLAAVGIPPDRDVHQSEVVAVEEDHPGARAEHRPVETP
jgi:hypothetical protein